MGVLLNEADMSVDAHGDFVGFEGRLADVAIRYGAQSPQVEECSDMIGRIRTIRSTE